MANVGEFFVLSILFEEFYFLDHIMSVQDPAGKFMPALAVLWKKEGTTRSLAIRDNL